MAKVTLLPISEVVSLLLGVEADHVFVDTATCRCGYKPFDGRDWRSHIAHSQADALVSAMILARP